MRRKRPLASSGPRRVVQWLSERGPAATGRRLPVQSLELDRARCAAHRALAQPLSARARKRRQLKRRARRARQSAGLALYCPVQCVCEAARDAALRHNLRHAALVMRGAHSRYRGRAGARSRRAQRQARRLWQGRSGPPAQLRLQLKRAAPRQKRKGAFKDAAEKAAGEQRPAPRCPVAVGAGADCHRAAPARPKPGAGSGAPCSASSASAAAVCAQAQAQPAEEKCAQGAPKCALRLSAYCSVLLRCSGTRGTQR